MLKKRSHKIVVACVLAAILVAVGCVLVYIFIPFYSYDHYPVTSPQVDSYDKMPGDYAGLLQENYYDADGYHRDVTVYVKEGSIHPLSYWRRLITWVSSPSQIRYVKYSCDEAREFWTKIQTMPESEAYAAYSFRFTGDLEFDEELGWRVFLIVDGKDAEFIKEELTKKYGDFVIFDSETYTEGYFKGQSELLIGHWYHTESRGYTKPEATEDLVRAIREHASLILHTELQNAFSDGRLNPGSYAGVYIGEAGHLVIGVIREEAIVDYQKILTADLIAAAIEQAQEVQDAEHSIDTSLLADDVIQYKVMLYPYYRIYAVHMSLGRVMEEYTIAETRIDDRENSLYVFVRDYNRRQDILDYVSNAGYETGFIVFQPAE